MSNEVEVKTEAWEDEDTLKFNPSLQKQLIDQTLPLPDEFWGNKLKFTNNSFFQIPVAILFAILLYYFFTMITSSIDIILH